MRVRTISSLFVLALVGCAPAAPAPEAPKPPPPAAKVTPPAPAPRATWSFPSAVGVANAQLDLGDKGVLQVGERGRRWLFAKGGGEPTQAATLAPQDLVDARVKGAKIVLLGEEGEVFTVADPLGAIESTKPAPKEGRAVAFRAGKDALLGLQKDGTLLRSTDGGATWSTSKVPLRPGDVAVGLAANERGEALALLHPQRLLLSSDDGATWKPLATPGIGATDVFRDAKGDLFLRGSEERVARLSGDKLEAAATPASFLEVPGKATGKKTSHESRHLAGDRVVTLVETFEPPPSKNQKLEVAIAAFGKAPATPASVIEKSVSRRDTRVVVAGYQGTVVVAVHDEQVDPPVTKFVRSADDGKTWEQVGTLPGRLGSDFSVWAGPSQIIVGAACDDESKTCKPAQAKFGTKDWQEIPLPPKSRLDAVEIDPAHDRAWILAWSSDGQALLTGSLSKGTFTKTPVELPRSILHATSVDANGALRLAYGLPSRVVRVAPDLTVQPSWYLPFEARAIDLAGERGFAWDGDDAWETADGGEKWAKVAPGTSGDIECAPSGCMQSGVVRTGWDLPDPKAALVASTAKPVTKKEASPPPPPPSAAPAAAPIAVACTAGGAWKPFTAMPPVPRSQVALDGDVRFTMRASGKDQALSLVVARGAGAPNEVSLLGPRGKVVEGVRVRQWTQESSEGFVAVRYAFGFEKSEKQGAASDSKYSPVDVEIGWYSGATGKAKKAKLAKVSPFRVGQAGPSALHAIVDGGLLFLPHGGDAPLQLLRDDGKTETMPRPPAGTWSDAVKIGGKIVLARVRQGEVALAATSDAGKSWATTTWTLGQTVTLAALDGKAALIGGQASWFHDATPSAIFAFDGLAGDPPDAVRVEPAKLQIGALEACAPKSRLGFRTVLARSKAARSVTVTVAPDKKDGAPTTLQLLSHVKRVDATGGACTDAVVAGADDAMWAIVSPHDPAHGWLVRAAGNGSSKVETRALSCKIAP